MKIPCRGNKTFTPTALDLAEWKAAWPLLDIEQEILRAVVWTKANGLKSNIPGYLAGWFARSERKRLRHPEIMVHLPNGEQEKVMGWSPDEPGIHPDDVLVRRRVIALRTANRFLNHVQANSQARRELRAEKAIAPHGGVRVPGLLERFE